METFEHPGINIQAPWCDLLLSGEKTIETRGYPLPEKFSGQWLWLIETPGPRGKFKARVRGRIKFSGSIEYKMKSAWIDDYKRHLVKQNDPVFAYKSESRKYGWIVEACEEFPEFPPPQKRGIVYAKPFISPDFVR